MLVQFLTQFRDWVILQIPYRPLRLLVSVTTFVIVFLVLTWLVRVVFNWVDRKLHGWRGRRLRAIRWQSQELLSEQDIVRIGDAIGLIGRRLAYLFVFLTLLQVIFVLVPETEPFGRAVLGYVVGVLRDLAAGLVGFVPALATIIVLYFIASYLTRFARVVFLGIERGRIHVAGFEQDWAPTTYRIVRGSIWVLFVVVAFPYLPFAESPAFQGLSIFFGVLFSLGGTQMMANLIAGVMLTYTNAFKIGDRVRIADAEGIVVAKTAHVTRIRTPKNVTVSVPNALVMSNHIINFTTLARDDGEGVVMHTTVTIGYDVPYEQVEGLLLEAANDTEHLEDEPAPFVLQTSLDDFYVAYQINAYTKEPEHMPSTYSDLHRNIQRKFHDAGVEIASPHLSALRDGNAANIPDASLPKNYNAPAFRIFPLGQTTYEATETPPDHRPDGKPSDDGK